MIYLIVILKIIGLYFLGDLLIDLLKLRTITKELPHKAITIVILYLFGTSAAITLLYFSFALGIPTVFSSSLLWGIAMTGLFRRMYLHYLHNSHRLRFPSSLGSIAFSIFFVTSTLFASFFPVIANDARGIWLLKTKILFFGKDAFMQFLQTPYFDYSHKDYPIGLPLLYADMSKYFDTFWEPAVGIFSFTFFFSLCLLIYGVLRSELRFTPLLAGMTTMVLLFTEEYSRQGGNGLSDVPLSLFIAISIYLFLKIDFTQPHTLFLPVSLAIATGFIKNEGLPFLIVFLLAVIVLFAIKHRNPRTFSLSTKTVRELLPFAFPVLGIIGILHWKTVIRTFSVENDLLSALNFSEIVQRIPVIYSEIMSRITSGIRWGILFMPAALLLFFPVPRRRAVHLSLALAIITLQFLSYLVIYLITPHNVVWHISTSFSRLLLHLVPSILILAIITYARNIRKNTV